MEKGLLYQTDIIGIIKGKRGTPGELTGIINYSSRYCLGDVKKNTKAGVYGKLDVIPEELTSEQQIPVGFKQEVQLGKAEIICTLEGERKSYDIEITQTNFNARETNKGIRFVVKDQELCALTGVNRTGDEQQPDRAERKDHRSGDPCVCAGCIERIWDLY